MEQRDQNIVFIIVGLILFLTLAWTVNRVFNIIPDLSSFNPILREYKLADFPDADKYLDAEAKERNIKELNSRVRALKSGTNERTAYQNWIDIGVFKKAFGDLRGAEEAWLEATKLLADPWIAYGNLADLYLYRTKELAKAEEYYTKAISLRPKLFTYYEGLANLYRYDWAETHGDKVEATILAGLAQTPDNPEAFYGYLTQYFTEVGNDQKVKEYSGKLNLL